MNTIQITTVLKKTFHVGLFSLLASTPVLADSAKFSETYSEKLVSVTEDGYRTYYVVPSDSGSFSSSILVAGLSQAQVGPDTELSFSLGNYEFEDIVDDADASTANSATFYQMYEDDAGRNHKIGQITFARGGNTLKVSAASSSLLDASPIAQ